GFYVAGPGRLSSATRSLAVMAFERSRSARAGNAETRSSGDQITAWRHDAGVSWTVVTTIIKTLRLLLLGMWLGAAIFFGAAVAPALFGVLRGAGLVNANELAGSIVTRLLGFIEKGGFEIALFLFVTAFFIDRNRRAIARAA